MEDIIRFISLNNVYMSECRLRISIGSGNAEGNGSIFGFGYGSGKNYGSGTTKGGGIGHGCGYGYYNGFDHGHGEVYGFSKENGYGYGYGKGLKSIDGKTIYLIDSVQTIIESVRNNIARGYIVNSDLTLTPCYVVKGNDKFAHGNTLREAFDALQEKLYDDSTEEERIKAFLDKFTNVYKKYPAKDLFHWHHVLTGSCKTGREAFCRDKGIDLENDSFTIRQFVDLTKDSYGGETVKKLLDYI